MMLLSKSELCWWDQCLGWRPSTHHATWVEAAVQEDTWAVCASLDEHNVMRTSESWRDLFEALHLAWQVALTVRHTNKSEEFVELCREVHNMLPATALKALGMERVQVDPSVLRMMQQVGGAPRVVVTGDNQIVKRLKTPK